MKLVRSDGLEMTIREIGPIEFCLTAGRVPLPIVVGEIEDAGAARERVKRLMETGLYKWGKE